MLCNVCCSHVPSIPILRRQLQSEQPAGSRCCPGKILPEDTVRDSTVRTGSYTERLQRKKELKQLLSLNVNPVTFLESVEAKFFLGGLKPVGLGPLNADSSNHEGTSCWACQSQSPCGNNEGTHRLLSKILPSDTPALCTYCYLVNCS